jgi:competence protein ComEA
MGIKDLILLNRLPLLAILVGLILIGLGLLFPKLETLTATPKAEFKPKGLIVDVAGAVLRAGVYQFDIEDGATARVEDALEKAGGLTEDADLDWISKNLNLATFLKDEMKIYIPKKGESLAATATSNSSLQNSSTQDLGLINQISINSGTEAELDVLPGVGPVTAQKIISNRPYASIDELKTKKVVSNATFEKIKTMVKI